MNYRLLCTLMRAFLLPFFLSFPLPAQTFPDTSGVGADTTAAADTVKKKQVIADTTVFRGSRPLHEVSSFTVDSTLIFSDHRAAADLMQLLPGTFVRSLGTIGQPEEITRYGLPTYYSGAYSDGLLMNERSAGNYDANLIRADAIDSIEALPLPRAFLSGSMNFPTALNFMMASRVSRLPFTRIRYYEGPNEEGALDVQMQQLLTKKVNLEVQFTNRKKDAGYANSGLSSWLIATRLSWAASRALTLSASHEYARHIASLFGGVNVDSLKTAYLNPTVVLYDEIRAPVISRETYSKQNLNHLRFSAVYEPSAQFSTIVNVFHSDNLFEFRKDETLPAGDPRRYAENRSGSVNGFDVRQYVAMPFMAIHANAGLENREAKEFPFQASFAGSRAYGSAAASFPVWRENLTPSVFAKAILRGGSLLTGAGADVRAVFDPSCIAYAGAAAFESDDVLGGTAGKRSWKTMEAKLRCSAGNFSGEANVFLIDESGGGTEITAVRKKARVYDTALVQTAPLSSAGAGFTGTYRMGFLLFEGTLNYISQRGSTKNSVPEFSGRAGIYYTGVHFDSNLTAKAGVYSSFRSGIHPLSYDAFYSRSYFEQGMDALSGHADLNFFAAGDIIRRAIVYFAWENLLDRQYFVTPYYPMPRRGIRFGLTWVLFN